MKKAFTVLAVLFVTFQLNAQWVQTNGPYGGSVQCLASNGSNIFLALNFRNSIYRSTNNGANWELVNNGLLPYTYVTAFAFMGSNVFAGTTDGNVFLSTNNGTNWAAVYLASQGSSGISSMAVIGSNLFVGRTGEGVMLTTDNGKNWTALITGIIHPTTESLLINTLTVSGSYIFAGTEAGVYRSTNNGTNWAQINNGLTNISIIALTVSDSNLFAATRGNFLGTGGGLFRSSDNGANWTSIIDSNINYVSAFAVSGSNLFAGSAGVFLSTNNGANWRKVNNGLKNNIVSSFAIAGNSIFAGTRGGGVYMSSNDGTDWTHVSMGIPLSVNHFAFSGNNIYSGTESGVYLSTNNGTNWVQSIYGNTTSLAVISNNVFAGLNDLYISSDFGTNWDKVYPGLPGIITSIISVGNNIFAYSSSGFYFTNYGGVYLSTDNGSNWVPVNNGLDTNSYIYTLVSDGDNIFVCSHIGVYRSTNKGSNWAKENNGLPYNDVPVLAVNGSNVFAYVNPADPYTSGAVFLSTNNGANWAIANNGLPSLPVSSFAFNGSYIFASADSGGVYLSTNNGTNWTQANNNGMPPGTRVLVVAINGNNIFSGTETGVWMRPLSELTGVANEVKTLPHEFTLFQNYPNPFNPSTVIKYAVPFESNVKMRFYNSLGQIVREVNEGNRQPGSYEINFNSSGLASGIYFYSIRAVSSDGKNDFSDVKKMLLLK